MLRQTDLSLRWRHGPLTSCSPRKERPLCASRHRGSCSLSRSRGNLQVSMQLPGPPGPLHLLSAAGASLLSSLRRHSTQLFALSVGSASLALALQHSQWNVVAEVAQSAAGRPEAVSLETWLACLALSNVGKVLACGGLCFLTARYFDRRAAASDDVLAVLHVRQGTLRRFSEDVLRKMEAGRGEAGEGWRMQAFRVWFEDQLELQDLVLSKITHPKMDPYQHMLRLLRQLGPPPADVDTLDWGDPDVPPRRFGDSSVGRVRIEGPSNPLPDPPMRSMGGKLGAGRRRKFRREDLTGESSNLEKERARLEHLVQQRSPSEQRERTRRHHAQFMAHVQEMQRRLDRIVGLPPRQHPPPLAGQPRPAPPAPGEGEEEEEEGGGQQ